MRVAERPYGIPVVLNDALSKEGEHGDDHR